MKTATIIVLVCLLCILRFGIFPTQWCYIFRCTGCPMPDYCARFCVEVFCPAQDPAPSGLFSWQKALRDVH